MTDRQTVSTDDYAKLKAENEKLRFMLGDLFEKLPEFENATNRLINAAYISTAHRALYAVSFVYMLIDLFKTYF